MLAIALLLAAAVLAAPAFSPARALAAEDDGSDLAASPQADGPVSVLFVGNSFTYRAPNSVPKMLASLAQANGEDVYADRVTENKAHLAYFAFPMAGSSDLRAKLVDKLAARQWDYVVLQENSSLGASSPLFEMYGSIRALKQLVASYQPGAEVLLYMTHGYPKETTVDGQTRSLSESGLQLREQSAYTDIADRLGVAAVPVGMLMYRDGVLHPYRQMLSDDAHHAAPAGYFLAACACYEQIFGKAPELTAPAVSAVDEQTQRELFETLEGDTSILPARLTLAQGQEASIGFTTTDPVLACATDDPAVATLGADGTVTAVGEGTSVAYVQSSTGMRATCAVHVEGAKLLARRLLFSGSSSTRVVGTTLNLGKRLSVSSSLWDYDLAWSSSNPSSVSVDELGATSALAAGKSTVTVRDTTSGTSASYAITVRYTAPREIAVARKAFTKGGKPTAGLQVKWAAVPGAVRYKVYRSIGSATKLVGTTTSLSFLDKTIAPNTPAAYNVVAAGRGSAFDSDYSPTGRGVVLTRPPVAVESGAKGPKVTWERNGAAEGYLVYRANKGSSSFKLVKRVTTSGKTAWRDASAKRGKTYRYQVRSVRTLGGETFYSPYSKAAKGKKTKK